MRPASPRCGELSPDFDELVVRVGLDHDGPVVAPADGDRTRSITGKGADEVGEPATAPRRWRLLDGSAWRRPPSPMSQTRRWRFPLNDAISLSGRLVGSAALLALDRVLDRLPRRPARPHASRSVPSARHCDRRSRRQRRGWRAGSGKPGRSAETAATSGPLPPLIPAHSENDTAGNPFLSGSAPSARPSRRERFPAQLGKNSRVNRETPEHDLVLMDIRGEQSRWSGAGKWLTLGGFWRHRR